MKIKTFIQHLAFWLMCTTTVANAQVKEISGKVIAKTGDDIIGATVIVEGTNLGTSTGSDGTYHIQNVPNNAQLTFSYIGYTSQTVDAKGRTKIDIALVEDTGSIDEVVVIGYGTAKKSDLTGSVSRVTAESFKSVPTTQIADALAGKVAGMAFTQSSGASGGGTMLIRGKSTQLAVANPLIVLDGVVYNGSVGDINPSDIETIDVMKDASSAAVYGSRAAAGVVFITTKRGTSGAPKINFTTSLGLSAAANLNKTYDRDGYLNYREDFMYEYDQTRDAGYFSNPSSLSGSELQSWLAMNPTASSDAELEWLKRLQLTDGEIEGYQSGMNTDWYDMAYRTGIHQAYDFNVSGGNQYSTYYLSMGYTDNEGIILGDDYDAFRAKLNLSIQATDFLKLGAYLTYSNKQSTSSVINTTNLKLMSPLVDSFNDDGSLDFQPGEMYASNPFITYYYQDSLYQNTNLFSIFTADLTLPFGITYQLSFQPRFVYSQTYIFNNTSTSAASGSRKDSTKYAYMIDNLFKWNKEIGKHRMDATFLYNCEKGQGWNTTAKAENFTPNENLSFYGLHYGESQSINVNDTYVSADALMARFNYVYDNKYLATISARRDGYSIFGEDSKYGLFPAFAVGWQLGREEWFNVSWVDQLKLRASWGSNGNRDIPNYSATAQLGTVIYNNGSSTAIGVDTASLANRDLQWESTISYNAGLDLNLFNNRIVMTADFYNKLTTNLLMSRALPITTGYNKTNANLGEIENKGVEITINTQNVNNKNFSWNSTFTFATNRNTIKELYGDVGTYTLLNKTQEGELPDYENEWFPGYSFTSVWDYKVLGVWQENEAEEAAKYGLKPGDYKVEDVNGDYKYTETEDKQFIGYDTPRWSLGFSNSMTFWKNLTLSFFLRADLGHIASYDVSGRSGMNTYNAANTTISPYWTAENANNEWCSLYPTPGVYAGHSSALPNYYSLSYLRLQDISLTYNFPKRITDKLSINDARVWGSVKNAFCLTKWPGVDPETGSTPLPRLVTFGLSFGF